MLMTQYKGMSVVLIEQEAQNNLAVFRVNYAPNYFQSKSFFIQEIFTRANRIKTKKCHPIFEFTIKKADFLQNTNKR